MTQAQGSPRIDVLLEGFGIETNAGLSALCAVNLIEGQDANGKLTRILVDPAHVGRRTFLQDALAARNLTTDDIDLVVLTHAHWDHVQNIDIFGNAPLVIHADERLYCKQPHHNDWATPPWTNDLLERMNIREVQDGEELIPGVGVVNLAGHTAGSIGLTVTNDEGVNLICGDALHYASVARTGVNPTVFWNTEEATASITRALDLADVIYPGHDQAFRMTRDGEVEYVRPFNLTIVGTLPDRPGLKFELAGPALYTMPGMDEQKLDRDAG